MADIFIGVFDVLRTPSSTLLDEGDAGAFIHMIGYADRESEFLIAARRYLSEQALKLIEVTEIDSLKNMNERRETPSDEFRYLSTCLNDDTHLVIGDIFAYEHDDEEDE